MLQTLHKKVKTLCEEVGLIDILYGGTFSLIEGITPITRPLNFYTQE